MLWSPQEEPAGYSAACTLHLLAASLSLFVGKGIAINSRHTFCRYTMPHLSQHPKEYHSCLRGADAGSGPGYEHALRTGCVATCRVFRNVEKQTCIHGCETLAREVRTCALQPPPPSKTIEKENISAEREASEAAAQAAKQEAAAKLASEKQAAAEKAAAAAREAEAAALAEAAAEEARKVEEAAAAIAAEELKNEEVAAVAAAEELKKEKATTADSSASEEAKPKTPPLPPTGTRPPLPEE